MRQIKLAEIRTELRSKKYTMTRIKGGHEMWQKDGKTIAVPCHKKEVNAALGRRLLKEM